MSSYKEITELAGYTHRVSEMIQVFEDVRNGRYEKQLATTASLELMQSRGTYLFYIRNITREIGKVEDADYIEFSDVPIISPNGDILVDSLNFRLTEGLSPLVRY